jgi:hypothetical protein
MSPDVARRIERMCHDLAGDVKRPARCQLARLVRRRRARDHHPRRETRLAGVRRLNATRPRAMRQDAPILKTTNYDVLVRNGKERFLIVPEKDFQAMREKLEDEADCPRRRAIEKA